MNHCSKFNDTNLAIRYGEAAVEENSHEPVALNTRPEDYCGQRKALIFQSIHIVRRASLFKHDTDFLAIDNALKVIATDAAIIARTVAGQASPQTGNFRYAGRTLEDLNDVPALDLLEQRDRELAEAARTSLEVPALDAPDTLITQPPSARQSLL